jgi:apolipoprotein N-acyltransferase
VSGIWGILIYDPSSWKVQRYVKVWCGTFLFWGWAFNWMFYPPIWTKLLWGGFTISLSFFIPLFILLGRIALHHIKSISPYILLPIVWCGCEFLRKNFFFGGMSYGAIEHTQFQNIYLIQIADIIGENAVGMLIIFIGVCIAAFWKSLNEFQNKPNFLHFSQKSLRILLFAISVILCVFSYGYYQIHSPKINANFYPDAPHVKIALLQGNLNATIEPYCKTFTERMNQYHQLSNEISQSVDVVVWPEEFCFPGFYVFSSNFLPTEWKNQSNEQVKEMLDQLICTNRKEFHEFANENNTPQIVGLFTRYFCEKIYEKSMPHYKFSAVFIEPGVGVKYIYNKHHLVPFLEYNPFSFLTPEKFQKNFFLYRGHELTAFPLFSKNNRLYQKSSYPLYAAINICFDSAFASSIRQQVRNLSEQNQEPDVLISMSNDGSFDMLTQIEMHTATYVFRSIENRKPYLASCNSGFAVWIDKTGRMIKKGKWNEATSIIAEIKKETPTRCVYYYCGDCFSWGCLTFNLVLLITGIWRSRFITTVFGAIECRKIRGQKRG